jgi:hypothetical protein
MPTIGSKQQFPISRLRRNNTSSWQNLLKKTKMKSSNLVRLINAFAIVICFGNWHANFLHASTEGAWEWNSISLFDLATLGILKFPAIPTPGYWFPAMVIAALLTGCLPLVTAFHGSMRPNSKGLLPVSIICSILALVSLCGIYALIGEIYGPKPLVHAAMGTYIILVIVVFEIVAGVISKRAVRRIRK